MTEKYKPHTLAGDRSPEKPEILSVAEALQCMDEGEAAVRLREIINQIDETELKSIFFEELQRCGVAIAEANFIPLQNINIETPKDTNTKISGIHERRTDEKEHGITLIAQATDTEVSFPNTLWSIIHEELHSVSTKIALQNSALSSVATIDSGISTTVISEQTLSGEKNTQKRYDDFNEGLTQLLSERIFKEYCRRTGEGDNLEKIKREYNDEYEYGIYRQKVDFFVGLIHAVSGVHITAAENALARTYFRNGIIMPEEFKQLLDERSDGLANRIEKLFADKMDETIFEMTAVQILEEKFLTTEERERIMNVWEAIAARKYTSN